MSATEIKLYKIFNGPLSESAAQEAVEEIRNTVKKEFERNKEMLASKQDIFSVREEIAEVKRDISIARAEITKYMLAQAALIIGLVVTLMKLL